MSQSILGPQDSHIVRQGGFYRDTRRPETRLWAFMADPLCAIVPFCLTMLCLFIPALFELWLLIGIPFTLLVVWRLPLLPMRMPVAARRRDPNFRDQRTRRPGKASGDWLMSVDRVTRQPGFHSTADMRTHCIVAGTTGSGKTRTLLCKQANVVAQGSGFTQVDGKGSNSNWKDVLSLARMHGREAEVRVVNFLTSSGSRETHTWNPFAHANADGIKNLWITLFIASDAGNGKGGSQQFFIDRGFDLIGALSELVAWARDERHLPINLPTLRRLTSDFDALRLLVLDPDSDEGHPRLEYWSHAEQRFIDEDLRALPPENGRPRPALPEFIRQRILNYMRETGGYTPDKAVSVQEKVREQHGYVVGGFGATFAQLSGTLGHIFNVDIGDIDMHDVLFNRRILTVILPVLENDKKVNTRLGRFILNAIRYSLAPGVGGQLSGDINEIITNRFSNAPTVYCLDFDEIGMYAAEGAQSVLAQARDLNFSTTLAFQEISSLQDALGKPAADALLSNPRLHFIMSLNDNTATKQWVESAAPRLPVSVNTNYQASNVTGVYLDQGRADVREMPLYTWHDVTSQQPGQCIVTFYGRRIYAEIPNIQLANKGYLRVPANLTLPRNSEQGPPVVTTIPAARTQAAAKLLGRADALTESDRAGPQGQMRVFCDAYREALSLDTDPDAELRIVYRELAAAFRPTPADRAQNGSKANSPPASQSPDVPGRGTRASEPDTGNKAGTPPTDTGEGSTSGGVTPDASPSPNEAADHDLDENDPLLAPLLRFGVRSQTLPPSTTVNPTLVDPNPHVLEIVTKIEVFKEESDRSSRFEV